MPIRFLQKRHLETANLYEYTLGHLQFAGRNGQVRTPLSLPEELASVARRVESLRERMSESERQVEGLFESLFSESFGGV